MSHAVWYRLDVAVDERSELNQLKEARIKSREAVQAMMSDPRQDRRGVPHRVAG